MFSTHAESVDRQYYYFQSWIVEVEKDNQDIKLNYYLFDKRIGSITLRNHEKQNIFLLHDINFINDVMLIAPISADAPFANLINYYVDAIQKQKYNQDIFLKQAYNYFEGPLSDYLDHELGHGLIISNAKTDKEYYGETLFQNKLFPILENEGIQYSLVTYANGKNPWLRDFNICMGNGKQIIHNEYLLNETMSLFTAKLINMDKGNFLARKWPKGISPVLDIGGSSTSSCEEARFVRKTINNYCQNYHIPFQKNSCILEGGNILTSLKDGKTHVIIGKNLLPLNAYYRRQINIDPLININQASEDYKKKMHKNHNYLYDELKSKNLGHSIGHIKEARLAIANALNMPLERIIWLDNYLFHIDMYISRGPDNIIFIQNNILTAETLMHAYNDKLTQDVKDAIMLALVFERKSGDILKQNKRELEKHGFKVVDVPAIACTYKNEDEDAPCPNLCNFMNGYSGKGRNGYFHITLDSRFKCLNNEFERILKENGVDNVYFIGQPEQAEDILDHEGSLRCLSNQASTIFGNLASSEMFASMPKDLNMDPQEYNIEVSISDDDSSEQEDSATPYCDYEEVESMVMNSNSNDAEMFGSSEDEMSCYRNNHSSLLFQRNSNDMIPDDKFAHNESVFTEDSSSLSVLHRAARRRGTTTFM